jgi:uracil-DNA glycosylase family 4
MYLSFYNSELTQCFPGKASKGDRAPTATEIVTCLGKEFLIREIELIKPKLLLLMGDKSRSSFYEFFVRQRRDDTLDEHIARIMRSGSIQQLRVSNLTVSILPIYHASGANRGNFFRMLRSERLLDMIVRCLGA